MITSATFPAGLEPDVTQGLSVRCATATSGARGEARTTPSGHRLYNVPDVQRLCQIVALRELGLPLEVIGELLAGRPDLAGLLADRLAHMDRQLGAIQALRRRLATMLARMQLTGPPSSADLLALMEEVEQPCRRTRRHAGYRVGRGSSFHRVLSWGE
jgi:DNA-binding transcriptional MerR regulator